MTKYILKVGYINTEEKGLNEFYDEVLDNLITPYELVLESSKVKSFEIPCAADCGDPTCEADLKCNLNEYSFQSEEDEAPINIIKSYQSLIMFEPVVVTQILNPKDPTDTYFWCRFEDQDEKVLDNNAKVN